LELSADLFEAITGCDVESLDPVTDSDRRRARRIPLLSRAAIYPVEGAFGVSSVVYMNDVSLLGAGFIHRERMSLTQEFILQLPCKRDSALRVLCVVRRCEECGPKFFVGASFERVLSDETAVGSSASPQVIRVAEGPRDLPTVLRPIMRRDRRQSFRTDAAST
jgi:hypothetical protein